MKHKSTFNTFHDFMAPIFSKEIRSHFIQQFLILCSNYEAEMINNNKFKTIVLHLAESLCVYLVATSATCNTNVQQQKKQYMNFIITRSILRKQTEGHNVSEPQGQENLWIFYPLYRQKDIPRLKIF